METITLKPLHHNKVENIGMYFANLGVLNKAVRTIKNACWSNTHKCWYVPLNKTKYEEVIKAFKQKANIENKALRKYLEEKKKQPGATAITIIEKPAALKSVVNRKGVHSFVPKKITNAAIVYKAEEIDSVNAHVLPAMKQHLKLKAYSPSTIKTYLVEMAQLLKVLKNIPADELSPELMKRYLVYCFETLNLTENTLHSRTNAMKFYYEQVLGREKFFWEIPRPKKTEQLPKVFNQSEIAAIIKSINNKKHKAMLMLAYGAGLRVSEVVSIKTYNIDSCRMCIRIEAAKGKKDRIVALSPVLLVMLREYAKDYKPDKKGWLFQGQEKDNPYSSRSLQEVLQIAKKKAGIIRPGSIHALRHSFATHLVEKGTDVTMIQKLLGHNDLKTTLQYLHTSNKDLLRIVSPLDDLKL